MNTSIHPDCERILIDEATLNDAIDRLAERLSSEFNGLNPIVVCILKGSVPFFARLVQKMTVDLQFDFMSVSSYGSSTVSSGNIRIKKDLDNPIEGRHVILIEDIIDSGNTLFKLKELLYQRNPASISIATLLDKPSRREKPIEPEYRCFEVDDVFIIGYGLDYAEKYRNLPYIGELKRSVYEK